MLVLTFQRKTCFHGVAWHRKVLVVISRSKTTTYWILSLDIGIGSIFTHSMAGLVWSLAALQTLKLNAMCWLIIMYVVLLGNALISQHGDKKEIWIRVTCGSIIRKWIFSCCLCSTIYHVGDPMDTKLWKQKE